MKRISNFMEMLNQRSSDESSRDLTAADGDGMSLEARQDRQPPTFTPHVTRREARSSNPKSAPQKLLIAPTALHATNGHWFSPDWVDENQFGHIAHGEFQSPVWVAISMAIAADRDRPMYIGDAIASTVATISETSYAHRGGELRALLACIAESRKVSDRSRSARSTSSGCFGTLHRQSEPHSADESLLYASTATILGLALAVYVRVRTLCFTGRAA